MYHFMVILTLALTSDLVKFQLFQDMVILYIELKGMKSLQHARIIFALTRFLDLCAWSKGQNINMQAIVLFLQAP